MIMPFIRLVTIYVVVVLAAIVIFNRDKAALLVFGPTDEVVLPPVPAKPAPAAPAAPVAAVPVGDSAPQIAVGEPHPVPPAPSQPPAAPVAQLPLQTPVADSAPAATPPVASSAAPAANPGDLQARWTAARKAWWQGDRAGAEAMYRALAGDFPDEPDILGELGNICYAQSRFAEAADYYHKAGSMLIGKGNQPQAMAVIGVLQGLAPDKAADLRNQIAAR
ncbi:MAG: tetratricopeptide repeat protein [Rhodobacteraceae bacterium]|nr:tetratricopeptide repeat protein [Paracoccaceae bacterium]